MINYKESVQEKSLNKIDNSKHFLIGNKKFYSQCMNPLTISNNNINKMERLQPMNKV